MEEPKEIPPEPAFAQVEPLSMEKPMVNHILSQWLTIFNHINMEISWNIHILGHLYENNIKIFEVIGLLGKVMTIHWMLGMIFWRKLHLSGSEAEGL